MLAHARAFARWIWGADGDESFRDLVFSTPAVWILLVITVVISSIDFALPFAGAWYGQLTRLIGVSTFQSARGEVWRWLTYALVNPPCGPHGTAHSCSGLDHLVGNMLGLVFVGVRVERAIGTRRFVTLYLLSVFVGGVAPYVVFPPEWTYGGGASAAIFALYGAVVVISVAQRHASRAKRWYFYIATPLVLASTVFPLVRDASNAAHYDAGRTNAAHYAGLATGLIFAVIWMQSRPRIVRLGAALSVALALVASSTAAAKTVEYRATDDGVLGSVGVQSTPTVVRIAFGSVWTTSVNDGWLVRIDPAQRRVVARISIGTEEGGDMVALANRLWVAADKGVVAVDPARNRIVAHIPLKDWTFGIATSRGSVWAALPFAHTLVRIDPRQLVTTARTVVSGCPGTLAADDTAIWATSCFPARDVMRFDAPTAKLTARVRLAGNPYWIDKTGSDVWIGLPFSIVRLDPTTLGVHGTTELPGLMYAFSADGSGHHWASLRRGFSIAELDGLGRVVRTIRVGLHEPTGIAVGGRIWVADYAGGSLVEVDPKRQ